MNTEPKTTTSSIETDITPDFVLQVLSDPRHLPQWAPGFVDLVEADEAGGWRATKGEQTFPIEVVAFGPARTVDYLREFTPGRKGGAFLRVLPRPREGSVIVMTLPLLPGASTQETATILNHELQLLAKLCTSLQL